MCDSATHLGHLFHLYIHIISGQVLIFICLILGNCSVKCNQYCCSFYGSPLCSLCVLIGEKR